MPKKSSISTEIERKFLLSVRDFKRLAKNRQMIFIDQGYLILKKNYHSRIRLSKTGEKFEAIFCSKVGIGLVRKEFEEKISLEHGKLLMRESVRVLRKQRLKIKFKGLVWDLDYYPQENFAIAEIEIPSTNFKIEMPEWAGREVTGMRRYSNINLARIRKKI